MRPILGGDGKNFAARGEHGCGAIGRDVGGSQVFQRLLYPVLTHLVEVGLERDRNLFFVARSQVNIPKIGGGGVDNVTIGDRCGLHVEDLLVALLFQVLARARPSTRRS